jgi:hypothetical protein
VKVYYLFSRNKKVGSRLIAWASGLLLEMDKVPSHVALDQKFVAESVLNAGVRLIPYESWLKLNEECYKVSCSTAFKDANEVFAVLADIWGKSYDWKGLTFFALCFLKHLLFKIPFPKENAWQDDDSYFCTEAAARLSGYDKHSMTTPAKMCLDFLEKQKVA